MTPDNNQPAAPLEALPEGFNLVWECSVCTEVLAHLEGCKNDGKHPDEIIEAIEAALANSEPVCEHDWKEMPAKHQQRFRRCTRCFLRKRTEKVWVEFQPPKDSGEGE